MKQVSIEKVLYVLENEANVVRVQEEVAKKALVPLEKMLEIVG